MPCEIDHSLESVFSKLESQKGFLPSSLYEEIHTYLSSERSQETLNEVFHLLKKYDLVSPEEQEVRRQNMHKLVRE